MNKISLFGLSTLFLFMITLTFVKNGVSRLYVKVVCNDSEKDAIVHIWTKRGYFLESVQFDLIFN